MNLFPPRASTARRRTSRRIAALAVVAAAAVALTACSGFTGSTGDAGGKVTVRFSYLWTGDEAKAVQKVIAKFNASQDKIVVKGTSAPDEQKQVLSMSSSKGQFDISDTGNSEIALWSQQGIIAPLDKDVSADSYDTSDFLPQAIKNNTYKGKLYALPVAANTYQLLYDKSALSAAGFSAPPKTFGEWATMIAAMTKKDANGQLTAVGGIPTVDSMLLAQAWGGSWYSSDGKPTPDDPKNVAALQWWQDTVVKPLGADKLQTFNSGVGQYGTAQWSFYTGQTPTVIDGNWQSQFIKRLAPKLDWGAAPLPYPDGEPQLAGSTRLELSNLFIPTNSAHPKEAWTFMKYFLKSENMLGFDVALANLPARTSLIGNKAFDQLPNFDVFMNALKSPNIAIQPTTTWSAQYTQDLNDAFQAIASDKESAATALAAVAQKTTVYAGSGN